MTDTMTRQEELQAIFWDLYKDAHGIRPRGIDTSNWTELAFANEFANLTAISEKNYLVRLESEREAEIAFEIWVQKLIGCGAKDRAMALRWVHDAEGSNGDDEYLCFLVGLRHGYFINREPEDDGQPDEAQEWESFDPDC